MANTGDQTHLTPAYLAEKALIYLQKLCVEIPSRQVGSAGNRAATDFLAGVLTTFGFETECPAFDCIDWRQDGVHLAVNGEAFEALVSPYSRGGSVHAPLAVITTVAELAAADLANKIVLLRGEITREQLMPKNFPFYNPNHHQRIYHLLETKQPPAIIAATTKDEALAGAVYPFPLIEDGDFDIPSVYMSAEEGERLAAHAGREVMLDIAASRIPATACNVVGRRGATMERRVVISAHIDAKIGTPGALDNASGVVVLMLLAELLAGYRGQTGVELLTFNSEDYYSAAGEILYVRQNQDKFHEILLNINIDALGYREGKGAYSLYGCPAELEALIRRTFAGRADLVEGEPWYQGDHGLFIRQQVPAMALTSDRLFEILATIAHTTQDRPGLVDETKLATAALALRDLLLAMA